MKLGSQTYGNPVIANGKVYIGTNNGSGSERYPPEVDLGVLLCFDEKDGKFLWQHSSEKLPTGRVHDWPLQGICCTACSTAIGCGSLQIVAKSFAWTRKASTTRKTTARSWTKR